jgi:hypothetical protein
MIATIDKTLFYKPPELFLNISGDSEASFWASSAKAKWRS